MDIKASYTATRAGESAVLLYKEGEREIRVTYSRQHGAAPAIPPALFTVRGRGGFAAEYTDWQHTRAALVALEVPPVVLSLAATIALRFVA